MKAVKGWNFHVKYNINLDVTLPCYKIYDPCYKRKLLYFGRTFPSILTIFFLFIFWAYVFINLTIFFLFIFWTHIFSIFGPYFFLWYFGRIFSAFLGHIFSFYIFTNILAFLGCIFPSYISDVHFQQFWVIFCLFIFLTYIFNIFGSYFSFYILT